ncbi:TPA: hypothetical protein MXV28_002239 [Pseudomonas aeruginosa]|nr:hypothetical protein [Pseudomonas aeruginosa]
MNKAQNECTCPSGDGSLVHPCPAHPAVEQAGGDERAAFEVWASPLGWKLSPDQNNCGIVVAERYGHPGVQRCWEAWQARAALAQPSPTTDSRPAEWSSYDPTWVVDFIRDNSIFNADLIERMLEYATRPAGDVPQAEQAEAERPEVAEVAFVLRNIGAMDAEDIDGDNVDLRFEDAEGRDTGCDVSIVEYAEKAADLLEQHERIVGDLRADRDSWAEQAEQRLADWDEMRKERDAALARVAEMEAKLSELEKQEPLLHINPLVVDELLGRAKRSPGGLTWSKGRCGSWTLPLYAAPVAQAQHSVPEGLALIPVRETEAMHDAVMALLYKGVGRTDTQKLLDAYIAAAPGKEGV